MRDEGWRCIIIIRLRLSSIVFERNARTRLPHEIYKRVNLNMPLPFGRI